MLRINNFPMRDMTRAEGNLGYLQFVALVKKMWEDSHPDIKIRPTQGPAFVQNNKNEESFFPVIVHGLEVRRAHSTDPKMRFREEVIDVDGEMFFISGQKFENIITFTVIDTSPIRADEVIEAFEDFMLEYTPVFKRLGVSEFMYSRRTPDNEATEAGDDLARRTVAYRLVTEKVRVTPVTKLEQIIIDARTYLIDNQTWNLEDDNDHATPIQANIVDLYSQAPLDD